MIKLKSLLKEYRKAVILSPSKAKKLIATIKKQERVSKVFKHKATYDGKMTTIYSIRARNKSHYSGNNPYGLDMSRDSKGGSYLIRVHESIVSGGIKSGGSEAGYEVVRVMTRGNNSRIGDLSNMTNWIGQYQDGVEFGLKKKMKVGGKVVSIVQIKVTGKDKYTIAYLDWDDGKRPLLTRKIQKNVSGKNLPKELKKNVKVY